VGKRIGAACVVGGCALVFGVASATAGWAGSRYAHGDCSLTSNGGRPGLFCQARFTTVTPNASFTLGVTDETCTSGIRLIRRTGTRVSSFIGYDAYSGPVPLSKFNIFGNETDFQDTWRDVVETDLGCSG
jgi:hypothetical protein